MSETLPSSWGQCMGHHTLIKHISTHPPDMLKKQVWWPEVSPADRYSQFWSEIAEQDSSFSVTGLFWSNFSHVLYSTSGQTSSKICQIQVQFLTLLEVFLLLSPIFKGSVGTFCTAPAKGILLVRQQFKGDMRVCGEVCVASWLRNSHKME